MEQTAQYLTWMRRELLLNKSSSHHFHSWEERAFAEDAAGGLGGCVWPPRSYSCSFCRREFRSAQALGGHMNVHRRDRARLKQSLIISSNVQEEKEAEEDAGGLEQFQSTERIRQVIHVSNNGNIVSKVKDDHDQKKIIKVDDHVDYVETNLSVGWSANRTGLGGRSEKAFRFSKRPRTGNLNQLPPPFAPADTKVVPFVGVQAAKGMELDLELRLGDFH